jgi:hypothetical protein
MRRRNTEGRIKAKIRALMLEAGWDVTLFWEQHGDYRIRKYQWDLACWGCHAKPTRDFPRALKGFEVAMACWSTMSDCARFGLNVEFLDRDGWEINHDTEKFRRFVHDHPEQVDPLNFAQGGR